MTALDPRLPTSKTVGLGEAYVVVGRKEHRCDLCGYGIPKGDPHWTWRLPPGMHDGDDWFVGRVHAVCHTAYWKSDWFDPYDPMPFPDEFCSDILAEIMSATSRDVVFR